MPAAAPTPAPQSHSALGWAIAVIILIAIIVGGFVAYARMHRAAPAAAPVVNVTLPTAGANAAPTAAPAQ